MKFSQPKARLLGLKEAGLAHYVVPAVIVLVIAIGGTAMLVASHADAPTKAPVITSATFKVQKPIRGKVLPNVGGPDGSWCAYVTVNFKVKIKGSADEVKIYARDLARVNNKFDLNLTRTSPKSSTWTGSKKGSFNTAPDGLYCVAKKGGHTYIKPNPDWDRYSGGGEWYVQAKNGVNPVVTKVVRGSMNITIK